MTCQNTKLRVQERLILLESMSLQHLAKTLIHNAQNSNFVFAMSTFRVRRAGEGDISMLMAFAEEFMHGVATNEERLAVLKSSLMNPDYELWVVGSKLLQKS